MIEFLYNVGRLPLVILSIIFHLTAECFTTFGSWMDRLQYIWLRQCRQWRGLDKDGKTPEMQRAVETLRYNTLIALGSDPFHKPCGSPMLYSSSTGMYYCGRCQVEVPDTPEAQIRQVEWLRREPSPTKEYPS